MQCDFFEIFVERFVSFMPLFVPAVTLNITIRRFDVLDGAVVKRCGYAQFQRIFAAYVQIVTFVVLVEFYEFYQNGVGGPLCFERFRRSDFGRRRNFVSGTRQNIQNQCRKNAETKKSLHSAIGLPCSTIIE